MVETYQIVTNQNGIEQVRVRGIPPVSTDNLGRKWISWVNTPQKQHYQEMNVESTFVFVGFTAQGYISTTCNSCRLIRTTQNTSSFIRKYVNGQSTEYQSTDY